MAEQGMPPVAQALTGPSGVVPASEVEQLERQRPPEQQPLLHVPPAQQISPRVPQRAHTPSVPVLVHARLPVHCSAAVVAVQQGWPLPPQAEHRLLLHRRPS
jgi:hypothetical protein